jgi:plasmid stabilization system protein ParE
LLPTPCQPFPHRGRPGEAAGTRELIALSPYLLIYEFDEAAGLVRILSVWHGARDRWVASSKVVDFRGRPRCRAAV